MTRTMDPPSLHHEDGALGEQLTLSGVAWWKELHAKDGRPRGYGDDRSGWGTRGL